jgi:hypothetical protein
MAQSNATRVANIATVVLLVVLCIAAIAGVIYGVTTHTEPGIDPRAIAWDRDRFPLAICPDTYVDGDRSEAILATQAALEVTNDRLDFEALALSLGAGRCDITVTIGVPAEPGWMDPGGDATWTHGPLCAIRTSNTGTTEILGLVLQHEIGHCLGLAHDDWEGSIMRRVQTETPDRSFPPRITDTDRETLRALYAPPG